MKSPEEALNIQLHGESVATLVKRCKDDVPVFELCFDEKYVSAISRPVLSLRCRDWRLDWVRRSIRRMPPFLTNLLPESGGAIRRQLARTASIDESDEFSILKFVGQDLSGAITAHATVMPTASGKIIEDSEESSQAALGLNRLRWSSGLGGMQLKFSVDRKERLTLPVGGMGGRWILKIPDGRHDGLVRAEYAAMLWAKAVGFNVPAVEIVDPRQVEGLPENTCTGIEEALLVRRFDRDEEHRPVHMEEFTSVLSLHPEEKYSDGSSGNSHNFVSIGRLVKHFAGRDEMMIFLSRIVFDIIVGNGDAHLKNWAFIFSDRRKPTLAPAYDIVPTVLYTGKQANELAIAFTSERSFRAFDESRIRQFATKLNESPEDLLKLVSNIAERAKDTFHASMSQAQLPKHMVEVIEKHWQGLPFLYKAKQH